MLSVRRITPRSHFDAQDYMEGSVRAGKQGSFADGWLNRYLA
jgi:uncharacterized protein (DUF1501 family)